MAHFLCHPVSLQHALLQLHHVLVLLLQARQGPELRQRQLHFLGRVAAELLHGHPGSGPAGDGLVHHTVAPATHLPDQAIPGCLEEHRGIETVILEEARGEAVLFLHELLFVVGLHGQRAQNFSDIPPQVRVWRLGSLAAPPEARYSPLCAFAQLHEFVTPVLTYV